MVDDGERAIAPHTVQRSSRNHDGLSFLLSFFLKFVFNFDFCSFVLTAEGNFLADRMDSTIPVLSSTAFF